MATRIYVSNIEAGYFTNNSLSCGPKAPTEGQHNVGDIVISSTQQNDLFGWVCVKAGEPGEWEVICDIVEVKNGIKLNSNNIAQLVTRMNNAELNLVEIEKDIEALDGRVKVNENSIIAINSQVDLAKKTLVTLTGQIADNTKNIGTVEANLNTLTETVNNIDKDNDNEIVDIRKELDTLKTLVGKNAEDAGEAASGILKEINDLKEFVGIGDGENGGSNLEDRLDNLEEFVGLGDGEGEGPNLQDRLEEIEEFIGLGDGENGGPNLLDRLDELEELVGKNAEDAGEAATGIQKEINDLKDLIGNRAEGENPATGLQKEVNENADNIAQIQKDMLKFWVGTQAEYDALQEKEQGRLYIIIN